MARKEWLIKGDRNSNYFYRKLSIRKKKKKICKIRDRDGIWIGDNKMIDEYFIEEYKRRFKS